MTHLETAFHAGWMLGVGKPLSETAAPATRWSWLEWIVTAASIGFSAWLIRGAM